ncbi:cytochrome P450 [Streptomyces sp. NPDC054849]
MPETPNAPMSAAPGAWPLLGHLLPLMHDPLQFLRSLPAHGDLVRVRVGPLTAVVVCDPELTRQVFADSRTFDNGGPLFDRLREVLGNSLATSRYHDHRRLRRLVQPAFRPPCMARYAPTMTEQALAVIEEWPEDGAIDVLAEMSRITTRILVATMFGSSLSDAAVAAATADVHDVVKGFSTRVLMPPPLDRLPTPGNLRYWRSRGRLRKTLAAVINDRRADRTDHGDLLSILLAAHSHEGDSPGLSDTELLDLASTLFIAGVETTATFLAWALHLVAGHPEVERRLHAEVDTVLGERPATHDDLPHLPLTGHIITETLRLYSFVFTTRTVTAAASLGGHLLTSGTIIVLSPYLIHHRTGLSTDPPGFDPDRWNTPPPRNAFIPFGAGAHKCIGDTYAMTGATLTLATIASRRRLHPAPGTQLTARPGALIQPKGLRMVATSRHRNPASDSSRTG